MQYTIENDRLSASIQSRGAELSSLWDNKSHRQLIWQGNPDVWAGHSPILFPVVGKVKNDRYSLNHASYPMSKHGFAMDLAFSPSEQDAASLTLSATDTKETRACYPFAFWLDVAFTLEKNRLQILHTVYNPSETETLPFSIGAHPGFRCLPGDELVFERDEKPEAYRLGPDMLLDPTPVPLPLKGGNVLTITDTLFEKDALILQNPNSHRVTLNSQKHGDVLRVHWFGAPVLGLWAKPGAHYVCVEPWYGIDDHADVPEELTQKPRIILLPPGQSFHFPISITTL